MNDSRIEYDAPHRTQTQILSDDLTRALTNLTRDWPHMLRPGETQAPGWSNKSGVQLDDHDPRDVDMRRIDRIISLRRYVQDVLNAWCRLVIEDRHLTQVLPSGVDVPAMLTFLTRHASWISGHESAQDCRDEISDIAHRCHLIAFPSKRDSISIGRCPLETPGELDVLTVCGGDVRTRKNETDDDGQAWVACSKCGQVAVASWWESKMFDDPETRRWLTDADVVTFMHRQYGEVIAQATVRKWVERNVLQPSGEKTEDGKRLFARDAVVYAIDLHKRRSGITA